MEGFFLSQCRDNRTSNQSLTMPEVLVNAFTTSGVPEALIASVLWAAVTSLGPAKVIFSVTGMLKHL